jgi:hypothetical protein
VLTQLVARALGEPGGLEDPPGPPRPEGGRQPQPAPGSVAPGVVQALGALAGEKLLRDGGVGEVAALCAITEDDVRDALGDTSSRGGAPATMRRYLGLLADGRSSAQARRKLKVTLRDLEALRRDPAAQKLDLRLGRALLIKTQHRDALRALQAHVPTSFGPSGSVLPPAMSAAAPHDTIRRLVLGGQDVDRIARSCGIRVDAARAALREVAAHPDAGEPLASILRLIADGRLRAEIATELEITHHELSAALEPLSSSSLQQKIAHAFAVSAVARPLVGGPRADTVSAGALGPGAQQMVPVRFPEAQHQRLKDWCATHGFSMAVVVRGLVERFLDDQERRAA